MSTNTSSKGLGSVLVVGGCGFLGNHVVDLISRSYPARISVLDLRTTRNRRSNVDYYDGDITVKEQVQSVFKKVRPDVVIHTASPPMNGPSKELLSKVNVDGTRCLLGVAGESGCVKAFVYTSSASVISNTVDDLVNADERWPVITGKQQTDYYADTKAQAERLVLAANRKHNSMLTTAIRPAGIIGEGDVQNIPEILKARRQGHTGFQLGSNDNLFDFTYVENAAHAHLLAAFALLETQKSSTIPLDTERVDGEAFLITNDSPVYFWDFPRFVWRCAGETKDTAKTAWTIPKEQGLWLAALIEVIFLFLGKLLDAPGLNRKIVRYTSMTRYYNIDKAKMRLGYRPIVGLEEGVRRAVRWVEESDSGDQARKVTEGKEKKEVGLA
ncbi:MAG: erg26, C-3 sterol dehydrogenase [Candelina submexicana]|nr:MAG: erg26, C-3 sterol dehydrogenase [Candelina submexicana]